MQRTMLKSKVHRATVTRAEVDYVGSIEIDAALMEAADIWENEQVHVWNVTTGDRFITYAVPGVREEGGICVNGAAAHRARVGDVIIIATFSQLDEEAARTHKPRLIFVDEHNQVLPAAKVAVAR